MKTIPLRAALLLLALAAAGCDWVTGPRVDRLVLHVGPERVACTGAGEHGEDECLLVREEGGEEWSLFHGAIEGFVHEEGVAFTLLVARTEVADPPADASSFRWTLIRIIERVTVAN